MSLGRARDFLRGADTAESTHGKVVQLVHAIRAIEEYLIELHGEPVEDECDQQVKYNCPEIYPSDINSWCQSCKDHGPVAGTGADSGATGLTEQLGEPMNVASERISSPALNLAEPTSQTNVSNNCCQRCSDWIKDCKCTTLDLHNALYDSHKGRQEMIDALANVLGWTGTPAQQTTKRYELEITAVKDSHTELEMHVEQILKPNFKTLLKYFKEAIDDIRHAKRHVPTKWERFVKDNEK